MRKALISACTYLILGFLAGILSLCQPVNAQTIPAFNLNSENGLASDHIYDMITDKYGYLWIATDRGVARFNGYDTRLYRLNDGLPNEDDWGLIEDLKGRIWISTQAKEVGYIKNDRYARIPVKNTTGTFSPRVFYHYDSGVMFSSFFINGWQSESLCFIPDDTLYSVSIDDYGPQYKDSSSDVTIIYSGPMSYTFNKYKISRLDSVTNLSAARPDIYVHDVTDRSSWFHAMYLDGVRHTTKGTNVGNHILVYGLNDSGYNLIHLNLETGIADTVNLRKYGITDAVRYVSHSNDLKAQGRIFVYTESSMLCLHLGDTLSFIYHERYDDLVGRDASLRAVSTHAMRSLWGRCYGTNKSGVYIADTAQHFIPARLLNLSGYRNVGTGSSSDVTFWFSALQNNFLIVRGKQVIASYAAPREVNRAFQYSSDTILLMGQAAYFLHPRTGEIVNIPTSVFGMTMKHAATDKSGTWFVCESSGAHVIKYPVAKEHYYYEYTVDADKYKKVVYDGFRNRFVAFTGTHILLYDIAKKQVKKVPGLTDRVFHNLTNIETEPVKGNYIIHEDDSLFLYNPDIGRYTYVHTNINLRNCLIKVLDTQLVIAGDFGMSFYRILPDGSLSLPVTRYNFRKTNYRTVEDIAACGDSILLVTGKETYCVKRPDASEYKRTDCNLHPVITAFFDNEKHILGKADTICLGNSDRSFVLDVINPFGNGRLDIYYRLSNDSIWRKSNAGTVQADGTFLPDKHYKVWVYFIDDGWKSDVKELTIYIKPLWWQTHTAKNIIWAGITLTVIIILIISVIITRRMVNKANERKTLRMELELKAIYAQINPHFIFNTLTSALLLVSKNQMDEAYAHISRFSKLLRSYLRSSRNKFITIDEEIENLKNYTELQQTRFKNRFVSDIKVDDDLNTSVLEIPSLLIQPFVENAINHGILYSDRPGILSIHFTGIVNGVKCTIQDNGIGRKMSMETKANSEKPNESYGNRMIKDLVEIFNKYEEMNITIDYTDCVPPDTGTIVTITILYRQV